MEGNELRINWSRLGKSTLVALCIVVGDFLLLALINHHFEKLPPQWVMSILHFIFWPLSFTQRIFPPAPGEPTDIPTHLAIHSAGLIDLIVFTCLVYLLWSLLDRNKKSGVLSRES